MIQLLFRGVRGLEIWNSDEDNDEDSDEGESDDDIETITDGYAEDPDPRLEDNFMMEGEVGGRQDISDYSGLNTQDHDAMEFGIMGQPAEEWLQNNYEGIGEGVDLGFDMDWTYGNEFMQ